MLASRATWKEIRPTTESSNGIYVLRSPSSTLWVRAGTHMIVVFRPASPSPAETPASLSSPTISTSTSGLQSFDYSIPGTRTAGWLDVASSRLSFAG